MGNHCALKAVFTFSLVPLKEKVQFKYVSMECGVQSAVTDGTAEMLQLYAISSDFSR